MKIVFCNHAIRNVRHGIYNTPWHKLGMGVALPYPDGQEFILSGGPKRFGGDAVVSVSAVLGFSPELWERLAEWGSLNVQLIDIVLRVKRSTWPFRVVNPLETFNPFDMEASSWNPAPYPTLPVELVADRSINESELPPIFTCGDPMLPQLMLRDDVAAHWSQFAEYGFQVLDVADWPLLEPRRS